MRGERLSSMKVFNATFFATAFYVLLSSPRPAAIDLIISPSSILPYFENVLVVLLQKCQVVFH